MLLIRSGEQLDGWGIEVGGKEVVLEFGTRPDFDLAEDGFGVHPHVLELAVDGALGDDSELVKRTNGGLGDAFFRKPVVSRFVESLGHDAMDEWGDLNWRWMRMQVRERIW